MTLLLTTINWVSSLCFLLITAVGRYYGAIYYVKSLE